mmetsp:Transcript_4424/g.6730  ORF Transcript_4424/g.6730 Transcript_4424/m.6730 type:complete len:225 (+) Transcript_4424:163-837(+)
MFLDSTTSTCFSSFTVSVSRRLFTSTAVIRASIVSLSTTASSTSTLLLTVAVLTLSCHCRNSCIAFLSLSCFFASSFAFSSCSAPGPARAHSSAVALSLSNMGRSKYRRDLLATIIFFRKYATLLQTGLPDMLSDVSFSMPAMHATISFPASLLWLKSTADKFLHSTRCWILAASSNAFLDKFSVVKLGRWSKPSTTRMLFSLRSTCTRTSRPFKFSIRVKAFR